jgi:hypothetical protein
VQRPEREILMEILEILRNQERRLERDHDRNRKQRAAIRRLRTALRDINPSPPQPSVVPEDLVAVVKALDLARAQADLPGTRSEST